MESRDLQWTSYWLTFWCKPSRIAVTWKQPLLGSYVHLNHGCWFLEFRGSRIFFITVVVYTSADFHGISVCKIPQNSEEKPLPHRTLIQEKFRLVCLPSTWTWTYTYTVPVYTVHLRVHVHKHGTYMKMSMKMSMEMDLYEEMDIIVEWTWTRMRTWKHGRGHGNMDEEMETWNHGNMETWKHWYIERRRLTWDLENMETWKLWDHGNFETWRLGDSETWKRGNVVTSWKRGDMERWKPGHEKACIVIIQKRCLIRNQ